MMTHVMPQRLYLIPLGFTTVPLPGGALDMVSGCYLVQMNDGTNILIDTGLPADYQQPGMPPTVPTTNVIDQLGALGLRPADVNLLICTHFDVDHAGYNDAFPQAELVVQRAHYELARSGHPRYAPARAHWDHPALHYRLVDGDMELLPGLTVIGTSGHAPAHQSVLVRLPQTGPVLLAIDAVMLQALFTPDRKATPADDNEDALRASTQKLLDLVAREHVALVVFGHDGQQWRILKTAPDCYE
ncbi:MAG: N-acyl homoserine lactonase family protein [Anaerolineae bacterium]|nr:N-acyl homoserine lactonase family protein [Anaerolineae bacterium]